MPKNKLAERNTELEKALGNVPYARLQGTITELMDLCGVTAATFNNWRSGRSCPKAALKIKINKYFGYEVYE